MAKPFTRQEVEKAGSLRKAYSERAASPIATERDVMIWERIKKNRPRKRKPLLDYAKKTPVGGVIGRNLRRKKEALAYE